MTQFTESSITSTQGLPQGMSREWCLMMVGSASVSIGLIQFFMGAWLGALFSVSFSGALWTSVALFHARTEWASGCCPHPPLGLWICRGAFLGIALFLGARILFL